MALESLFNGSGLIVAALLVALVVWLVGRFCIAWRDRNGNGVIDEGE